MLKPTPFSVFVIDDNEIMRMLLRTIIQSDRFNVIGDAADGKSGLERATHLRPDIVCLDIIMPDENGLETLSKLKAALPQTQVLMITANNDRETVRTAISRGASGFILKPFNAGILLDTIEKTAGLLQAQKKRTHQ